MHINDNHPLPDDERGPPGVPIIGVVRGDSVILNRGGREFLESMRVSSRESFGALDSEG